MALRTIAIDELNGFQLDDSNQLYWRGQTVVLEQKLKLERYQIVLATIGAVGALLAGVHPFLISFGIFRA
jgi:hypothetical protein